MAMTLKFRQEAQLDVLEYAGINSFDHADCEVDDRVRTYLIERIQEGQKRFLMDVRELHLVYSSSKGGLINSWLPAVSPGGARIAVTGRLSARHEGGPNWELFDEEMQPLEEHLPGVIRFFESETEARQFLVADGTAAVGSS